nr:3'-5' exonuclease KapD [Bacillus alkalicellulosilyticus]
MSEHYLFIDFEFSMPEEKKSRTFVQEIIEVGLVSVVNGEVYDTFAAYVKPMVNHVLTERCKSFLHMSQEQVDSGISFEELVMWLDEYQSLGPTTVVTWGNQDMRVLFNNCKRHNIRFPFRKRERDLSIEYKKFFGDRNQTGLWKAIQEYGEEGVGNHHRALDDALTTYEIFKRVEKDKSYMKPSFVSTIGERIDFSSVLQKLA